MKLAIVGSRTFNDFYFMKDIIDSFFDPKEIESIVSGGAKGADSLAREYANHYNIPINEILPKWNTYGLKAGMLRNKEIVDEADIIVAFWDSKSKGTRSSIKLAHDQKKTTIIIYV